MPGARLLDHMAILCLTFEEPLGCSGCTVPHSHQHLFFFLSSSSCSFLSKWVTCSGTFSFLPGNILLIPKVPFLLFPAGPLSLRN